MSKLKKLKFSINKNEFTLPLDSYREQTWGGSLEKYIHMSAKNSATVIKQFVKQNFPDLKVWAVSDTYSGGSSTRVNVSNTDGSSVDSNIHEDIRAFGNSMKMKMNIIQYGTKKVLLPNLKSLLI